MDKLILIKYGELTTKKDNRKFFINTLETNIKKLLKDISTHYRTSISMRFPARYLPRGNGRAGLHGRCVPSGASR